MRSGNACSDGGKSEAFGKVGTAKHQWNDRDAVAASEKSFDLDANPVGGIIQAPGAVAVVGIA